MHDADNYAGGDHANNREKTLKIIAQSCIFQLLPYQLKIM